MTAKIKLRTTNPVPSVGLNPPVCLDSLNNSWRKLYPLMIKTIQKTILLFCKSATPINIFITPITMPPTAIPAVDRELL